VRTLSNSAAIRTRYGNIHWRVIRAVWREATRTPCASVRELAAASGCSFGIVGGCLRFLRDAGYIAFESRSERARRIVVPFVEEHGGRS